MIFADVELARRIEGAEAGLTREVAETVRVSDVDRAHLICRDLGGGVGVWIGDSPFDKVVGWGFGDAEGEDDALRAFEDEVAERGGPVQLELSTLAELDRAAALGARGYALVGVENVLGLRLDGAQLERLRATRSGELEVRVARDDEDDAWIDTVVTGFSSMEEQHVAPHEVFAREALVRVFRDLRGASGHRRYVALGQGALVGGASLRVHGGRGAPIAQLSGAATLPAHRRRGVQSALLRARLLDAADAGCELAVVTTSPGSRSQQNVQRAGFELLYARLVMLRPAPR